MSADVPLERACEAVRRGALVIFPTETFYGLGTRADDASAATRVVAAKGRKPGSPFPLIAADREQAEAWWTEVPAEARRLMDALWPGPLTLVLPARTGLPPEVVGSGRVGIRVSSNALARELAKRAGPLIATSANRSGEPEVTRVRDLSREVVVSVEVVLDAGDTPGGRPSTVVAWGGGDWSLIREGQVAPGRILEILGRPRFAQSLG